MRRQTLQVKVGSVTIGSEHSIVVQSMTNTDTANLSATVQQIIELSDAGSELVRITVNSPQAAAQVAAIREQLDARGYQVPLVGDFHFNGDRLFRDYPECAISLAKYRINPGNVGKGVKGDKKFAFMIEKAIEHNKVVRIGVNWGSLDQQLASRLMDENNASEKPLPNTLVIQKALVMSAIQSAQKAIDIGLPKDKIVLSCKVSNVQELVTVYQDLASRCDFPLHLGLTEAGMGSKGIVASSSALAILLQQGIGDTIRISLTPQPNESRTNEVRVAQELLQCMGLRSFMPLVVACPGCGRTTSTFFQKLAMEIQEYLRVKMSVWREHYPGVENMKVAVMGCVVNGPGESKMANIGISLPGTGETPIAPVYVDGEKKITLKGNDMATDFIAIVEDYVQSHYAINLENKKKENKIFDIKLES